MFKRHALQVKMVKTDDSPLSEIPGRLNYEAEAQIVADGIRDSVKTVSLAVCGYIVLDTIRQVVVARAQK